MHFILVLSIFLFSGCGYKPTISYAKNAITGSVYVDLDINIDNSANSIIIKDAVNKMIINQFAAKLTNSKISADTYLYVKLQEIVYKAISSDEFGYVDSYRTTVKLLLRYKNHLDNKLKTLSVSNYDDYLVSDNTVSTEENKQESIKNATRKALDDILIKIAVNK